MGQLSDQAEVLSAGQVLVDGRILPREADGGWDLFRVADNVESEHPRLAAVRFEHRRQDPNSGGLPAAVRPEQAQHSAGLDRKIDSVEGDDFAEPLDEPARGDCGLSHSRFLAGVPATRQRYVPSAFIPPGRVGLVGHAIREQVVGHRFLHKCLSRHHVDLLPLRFSRDRVYRHRRGPKGGGPDR